MPTFYTSLEDTHRDWALSQPLYFTASAPRYGRHVNVSPKGWPRASLHVFGPNSACYIDAIGSGAETISHVYENGRVTIMFCSFGTSPRIMRWFCTGRVVERDDAEFKALMETLEKHGKSMASARAVIMLDIFKVQTSCGFGVPHMGDAIQKKIKEKSDGPSDEVVEGENAPKETAYEDRPTLENWGKKLLARKGDVEYIAEWNWRNLDGYPSTEAARKTHGESLVYSQTRAWCKRTANQRDGLLLGLVFGMVLMYIVMTYGLQIQDIVHRLAARVQN